MFKGLKNKKGFTLVELLAVIVVLAIIALIGYTIVGDVISGAQESADKENVREYARSVRLAITSAQMNGETVSGTLSNDWLTDNVEKTGNEVVCSSVTDNNGTITLSGCTVTGGADNVYCYDGNDVTTCTRANNNIVKIYGTNDDTFYNDKKTINLLPNSIYDINSYGSGYNESKNVVYKLPFISSGTTYTVSLKYSKESGEIYYYLKEYITSSGSRTATNYLVTASTSSGTITCTFNAAADTEYYFYANGYNYLERALVDITEIQIEEGNNFTQYEPYGYKISVTATKEDEPETDIIVYIGGDKLGANDYLSYDGANWKVVRNGVPTDPVKVLIGSSGTDAMPTGKVTYSVDGLDDSNIVYNYE